MTLHRITNRGVSLTMIRNFIECYHKKTDIWHTWMLRHENVPSFSTIGKHTLYTTLDVYFRPTVDTYGQYVAREQFVALAKAELLFATITMPMLVVYSTVLQCTHRHGMQCYVKRMCSNNCCQSEHVAYVVFTISLCRMARSEAENLRETAVFWCSLQRTKALETKAAMSISSMYISCHLEGLCPPHHPSG